MTQVLPRVRLPILAIAILGGLYLTSRTNYLLFHTLAELFSIIIAGAIFALAWNSRQYSTGGYLLFIGISHLFIGSIDLAHTLAYRGMDIFAIQDTNLPTQLWLAARYLQAASFLLATFFVRRTFRPGVVFSAYLGVTALLLLSIFTWNVFPVAHVEDQGLTSFKIVSEYAINVILAASMVLLWRGRKQFDPGVLRLLLAASAATIVAELALTFYVDVYDFSNLVGHYFKIIAFFFLYKALVETSLFRPYNLLFRDIQERERLLAAANQDIERHRTLLRTMFELDPAAVAVITGTDLVYQMTNPTYNDLITPPAGIHPQAGQPSADLPGKRFTEVWPQQNLTLDREALLEVIATGAPLHIERYRPTLPSGRDCTFTVHAHPLQWAGEAGVLLILWDTTRLDEAIQRAEQATIEAHWRAAELEAIMEAVPAAVWIAHDRECRVVTGNQASYDLLRMPTGANPSKTGPQAAELASHYKIVRGSRELLAGERPMEIAAAQGTDVRGTEMTFVFADGSSRHVFGNVTPLFDNVGQLAGAIGAFVDISEMVNARQALANSEARFRRLVESNIIGVIFSSTDGRIQDANDAFLRMVGYTQEDLAAGKIRWLEMTPPEYLPLDRAGIAEANERGACTPFEKEYIRKDGSRVPILMGFARLEGSLTDYVCFVIDLSDLKHAEAALADYAVQLERSNRELEEFAFVASHDLQEPLRKIQAFGKRLELSLGERISADEADFIERMQNAARRMEVMISALLALSRVTTRAGEFQPVDLNQVAAEVLQDLEVSLERSGGQVQVDPLPTLEADPLQMHQLLQNLIGNGLKFRKPGQAPWVHVYASRENGASDETSGSQPLDKNMVQIVVEDHGIGFDETLSNRIFKPFQRLVGRSEYEGSGVGLAICSKIVERHGGTIFARSAPGKGSRFIASLPVHR